MEVKTVYMDLQEGKKKGNVWKLESEAFKKPIEIKIWFENKELVEFNSRLDWIEAELKERKTENITLRRENYDIDHWLKLTQEELFRQKDTNIFLGEEIQKNKSELKELYKAIADAKSVIELQSGTILKLQEQVKELEKKVTKQPTVIHDKWFISWRESSGLWMINLQDGDYLMIAKYVVGEHNEYVTNQDEITFDKIHVEGQHYVPFYKLEWGTELDTPTATIYYDLIFIPI